ncbi:MAG: YcfL family protein [Candidatus Thiodiazotropha sp.]|jgi:uncharacterized protein YcfL
MVKLLIVLSIVAASTLFAGCQSGAMSDPNVRNIEQKTIVSSFPRARLVLGSDALLERIAMVDARIGEVGQLTRAEVSIQNLTNTKYTLEYMYAWEDEQGFSINENRVWKRFSLGPKEIKSFKSVGGDPNAYSVTMTVRMADDVFMQKQETK